MGKAWAAKNMTKAIEALGTIHLSEEGPLLKSGVTQPPFLLVISGRLFALSLYWNVRGLGRTNLSPDEVTSYKKQGIWNAYFDKFVYKCKFNCRKGEEGYSLTPHVAPNAGKAKILHFNGRLKPSKAGRRSQSPVLP